MQRIGGTTDSFHRNRSLMLNVFQLDERLEALIFGDDHLALLDEKRRDQGTQQDRRKNGRQDQLIPLLDDRRDEEDDDGGELAEKLEKRLDDFFVDSVPELGGVLAADRNRGQEPAAKNRRSNQGDRDVAAEEQKTAGNSGEGAERIKHFPFSEAVAQGGNDDRRNHSEDEHRNRQNSVGIGEPQKFTDFIDLDENRHQNRPGCSKLHDEDSERAAAERGGQSLAELHLFFTLECG